MNQKCSVCKEPAAGYHFGAFTCEGCKSFFGRTYSNPGSVSECKNGGNCEINKKNRTSCKACRLKKCILAGMSKSSSRYGRRSNSFKATYASGHAQEDKQSEKPHIVPSFGLYPSTLLSRPCIGFDDETDAASTVQKNSTGHINDVANFHNNGLFIHNWHASFQPQLSITPLSTSTPVASLPISNQIQRQSPMQYCPLPVLSKSNQSLMESQSRNTSDSDSSDDDERLPDVEYKSSSSRVSPFTLTNKIDEPTLSSSSLNGSLMLTDTHNPYLYSIPGMITPTAYSARGGDSLLVSPNPGGLADERDEPIDLSIRASSSLSQSNNESSEKKKREEKEEDQINDSDSSTEDCAVDPLDLTLDARPIIRSLRSTSRSYC